MRILNFKTLNTAVFRTLFETLKEILSEINIHFTPNGFFIRTSDKDKGTIISLDLNAENFEEYHCGKDEINIGINLINFNKIIKTCPLTSVLQIYYDDEEEGKLFISMIDEEKSIGTKFELNLIETNESHINLSDLTYIMEAYLPCALLQKNIKDIKNFSDIVEIEYFDDKLFLICDSGFINQKTVLKNTDKESGLKIKTKSQKKISGKYSLESIIKIIKCTNLCEQVKISFIEKNQAGCFLSLIYEAGNLGTIQFILMKKKDDEDY